MRRDGLCEKEQVGSCSVASDMSKTSHSYLLFLNYHIAMLPIDDACSSLIALCSLYAIIPVIPKSRGEGICIIHQPATPAPKPSTYDKTDLPCSLVAEVKTKRR
jgi:hypothetical protein